MSTGTKSIIFTLLAAAAVYFAGNGRVQLWDRDEPRYAQCSRQMLDSGDWVVPRLYDNLRFQKPPLIYWCQASAMRVFGKEGDAGAFAARVPSAIAMLATLTLLAVVLSRQVGVEQAAWTIFVFASSALAIVAAKICLTDSVLIFFIIVAQLCLYAIWRGNRSWAVTLVMAIAVGLGFLTKGPFILGILGCTAVALGVFRLVGRLFERRVIEQRGFAVIRPDAGRALHADEPLGGQCPPYIAPLPSADALAPSPLYSGERAGVRGHSASCAAAGNGPSPRPSPPSTGEREPEITSPPLDGFRSFAQIAIGIFIVIAMVAPWVWLVRHRAPDFLPAMLHEGKQHAIAGKEGHHFPPGYHFVLVWGMFMPWSLLLPLAIGVGIKHRKIPEIRFALAAVLGPWLMVEFMGTKLPHYFLPAYPALAYLVAFAIRKRILGEAHDLRSLPFRVGTAVWGLAVAAIVILPWLAARTYRPLPWGAMGVLTCIGLLYAGSVCWLVFSRRFKHAFIAMGVGMFVSVVVAFKLYLPRADFLRISVRVARVLIDHGATHRGDVKMVDYKEPSLGFYQGGTIREVEKKSELISRPLSEWPHWVVITREAWEMIPAGERPQLRIIESVKGLVYADQARRVEVMIVEKK